jgi:hypothetical protein
MNKDHQVTQFVWQLSCFIQISVVHTVMGLSGGTCDRAKCDQSVKPAFAFSMAALSVYNDPFFVAEKPKIIDDDDINRIPVMAPILVPIFGVLFLRGCFSLKNWTYCPVLRVSATPFKSTCLFTTLKGVPDALYGPHLQP